MYWFPKGFTYDERDFGVDENDDPVVDDETLETFNADDKAQTMLKYA